MIPVPATVPTIAGPVQETAVWNALLTYAGAALPIGNGAARLAFGLSERPHGNPFCLRAPTAAGVPLLVVPRVFPFKAMFGIDLAVDAFADLPAPLATALIKGIVDTLRPLLGDHQAFIIDDGMITRLSDLGADIDSSECLWLDMRIDGAAKEPVLVTVGGRLPRLLIGLFTQGLLPAATASGLGRAITVPVAVTLGRIDLSRHELGDVGNGDLLVLDVDVALSLRCRDRFFRLSQGAQGWVIDAVDDRQAGQGLRLRAADMNEEEHGGGAAAVLAALPLSVDVDVATLDVSLAEIEGWRTGSLIPLPIPAVGPGVPVTLSVAGRRIANGDLVRIDDRLAVRLTRL